MELLFRNSKLKSKFKLNLKIKLETKQIMTKLKTLSRKSRFRNLEIKLN